MHPICRCVILALALVFSTTAAGLSCPPVTLPPQANAPAKYNRLISYGYSDDPDLKAKALQLDSSALIERERCKSIGSTGGAADYATTCEKAFRERVEGIPTSHFTLGFCPSDVTCPTATKVGDVPSDDAISTVLNQTFTPIGYQSAAALGVYSLATNPCTFISGKDDTPIPYTLSDDLCTAVKHAAVAADSVASAATPPSAPNVFTERSDACTRKNASFSGSWKANPRFAANLQLNMIEARNWNQAYDCLYSTATGYILDEYQYDANTTPHYSYQATIVLPKQLEVYEDSYFLQAHLTAAGPAVSFYAVNSDRQSATYGKWNKGCLSDTYLMFDAAEIRHLVSDFFSQQAQL